MKIFNANLEVTKATVQGGEIKELEINRQNVPLASSVKLEANKTVTITENGPVEITPTSGKDAMQKVTATVNVSGGGSGGIVTLYAWIGINGSLFVYTLSATPSIGDDVYGGDPSDYASKIRKVEGAITAVGENTITVADESGAIIPETYTRSSEDDLILQA